MKKILVAVFILGVISSFYMVRFYFASIDIYNEYVNQNTLIYLSYYSNIENLPEWTTTKNLWHDIQIDYQIRFLFMIVIFWVLIKLINRRETMIIPLFAALAISIVSCFFMIFYFAASNDIYNEYVNKTIVTAVNSMPNMEPFPEWPNTSGEWLYTLFDFILRIVFMIYISVLLIKLIFEDKKQAAHK